MNRETDILPTPARMARSHRLVARVNADQKRLFQRAAALQGRTLSDFVIASAQEAAQRTIRDQEVIALGAADSATFVAGLLNPPAVNDRLCETVRRYSGLMRTSDGG